MDARDPNALPSRDEALAALDQGDPRGVEMFRRRAAALADDPVESLPSTVDLGLALLHVGGREESVDVLRRAVDADGDYLPARRALARALEACGRLDDAVFQLLRAARAAQSEGGDAEIERELGALFYRKHLPAKACAAFERSLALRPETRTAYDLGLAREAARDVGGAIAAYREAVRLDPRFFPARKTLADALAMMGEHEAAIAVLDDLLRIERTNEQAALNKEVLQNALRELKSHRLLGRTEVDFRHSALVQEGQHKLAGRTKDPPGYRYVTRLSEVLLFATEDDVVRRALLVFPDVAKAAKKKDDRFHVTVVDERGAARAADYVTAVSLTFLRELLGIPLTQAGDVYRRLLAGEPEVRHAGASARFVQRTVDGREFSALETLLD